MIPCLLDTVLLIITRFEDWKPRCIISCLSNCIQKEVSSSFWFSLIKTHPYFQAFCENNSEAFLRQHCSLSTPPPQKKLITLSKQRHSPQRTKSSEKSQETSISNAKLPMANDSAAAGHKVTLFSGTVFDISKKDTHCWTLERSINSWCDSICFTAGINFTLQYGKQKTPICRIFLYPCFQRLYYFRSHSV